MTKTMKAFFLLMALTLSIQVLLMAQDGSGTYAVPTSTAPAHKRRRSKDHVTHVQPVRVTPPPSSGIPSTTDKPALPPINNMNTTNKTDLPGTGPMGTHGTSNTGTSGTSTSGE